MVSSGNDTGHKHRIDEAARNGTAGLDEDNREGTGGSIPGRQTGVVVWHIQPDDNDGNDIKENNPPKDVAHDSGEILGWVLGLAGCDSDGFSSSAETMLAMLCQDMTKDAY